MRKIKLQFPLEDDAFKSAVQAANEEKQERAEEEHVETEAAANEDMPRIQTTN